MKKAKKKHLTEKQRKMQEQERRRRTRKKLKKKIEEWKEILLLQQYDIYGVETKFEQEIGNLTSTISTITTDYPYVKAIIQMDTNRLTPEVNLDRVVSHELLHIHVGKIYNKIIKLAGDRITEEEKHAIKDQEETVVDTLSKAFCKLRGIPEGVVITNEQKEQRKKKKKGSKKREDEKKRKKKKTNKKKGGESDE